MKLKNIKKKLSGFFASLNPLRTINQKVDSLNRHQRNLHKLSEGNKGELETVFQTLATMNHEINKRIEDLHLVYSSVVTEQLAVSCYAMRASDEKWTKDHFSPSDVIYISIGKNVLPLEPPFDFNNFKVGGIVSFGGLTHKVKRVDNYIGRVFLIADVLG